MFVMKFALCFLAIRLTGFTSTSRGYVLEGQSWPSGTVVVVQLNLGNAGRTLQDGNTSWDAAVAPVAGMWNEKLLRIQVVSPGRGLRVPAGKNDYVNSVVFSSTVFGQSFGGTHSHHLSHLLRIDLHRIRYAF